MGVANDEDIVFLHHKRLPWGNVVFKKDMEKYRDIVREYIFDNQVKSVGRLVNGIIYGVTRVFLVDIVQFNN